MITPFRITLWHCITENRRLTWLIPIMRGSTSEGLGLSARAIASLNRLPILVALTGSSLLLLVRLKT